MRVLLAVCDLLLLLGATLRIVRLVVADDFPGTWLIRQPAEKWAETRDSDRVISEATWEKMRRTEEYVPGPREKLVQGLSCPFCIGLWIAAGMVLLLTALGGPGQAPDWWRTVAGILTLNWVAAHLGARAGDTADD